MAGFDNDRDISDSWLYHFTVTIHGKGDYKDYKIEANDRIVPLRNNEHYQRQLDAIRGVYTLESPEWKVIETQREEAVDCCTALTSIYDNMLTEVCNKKSATKNVSHVYGVWLIDVKIFRPVGCDDGQRVIDRVKYRLKPSQSGRLEYEDQHVAIRNIKKITDEDNDTFYRRKEAEDELITALRKILDVYDQKYLQSLPPGFVDTNHYETEEELIDTSVAHIRM